VDFYATAAQIIPVFFLAMAFESRALLRLPTSYDPKADPKDPRHWNAAQIVGILYFVILMTCGELAALLAVAMGRQNRFVEAFTWLGLVGGLAGVVGPILKYQWDFLTRHYRTAGMRGNISSVVGVTLSMSLLTYTITTLFFT
jgi:hypothetical protein